jgi:hypothetical protein
MITPNLLKNCKNTKNESVDAASMHPIAATDADLQLISAAPELLDCLRRVSPVVNDYDFRCSADGKSLSDRINTLLAKFA